MPRGSLAEEADHVYPLSPLVGGVGGPDLHPRGANTDATDHLHLLSPPSARNKKRPQTKAYDGPHHHEGPTGLFGSQCRVLGPSSSKATDTVTRKRLAEGSVKGACRGPQSARKLFNCFKLFANVRKFIFPIGSATSQVCSTSGQLSKGCRQHKCKVDRALKATLRFPRKAENVDMAVGALSCKNNANFCRADMVSPEWSRCETLT